LFLGFAESCLRLLPGAVGIRDMMRPLKVSQLKQCSAKEREGNF